MSQSLRDQASDSDEIVTPRVLDGTCLPRNFATSGPVSRRSEFWCSLPQQLHFYLRVATYWPNCAHLLYGRLSSILKIDAASIFMNLHSLFAWHLQLRSRALKWLDIVSNGLNLFDLVCIRRVVGHIIWKGLRWCQAIRNADLKMIWTDLDQAHDRATDLK